MTTIYDIAHACGVSIATVSRVLNGSTKVSPKTREKVLAAMREQNYSPNPFARGLGLDSMKMIGILCTDVSDAFFAKAVSLAEHGLRKRGFDVILACSGSELVQKKKYLQLLLNKHVDAIVLVGSPFREDRDNSHLEAAARQVPIIAINSLIELPNIYSVLCDESAGVKKCVELLIAQQHTSILYLYDQMTYSGQQKIRGYRDGFAESGVTVPEHLIQRVERTLQASENMVDQLLSNGTNFSAILTSEDLLAVGAQKALVARGLSMPVIGCNNSILAECSTPALTSIDNRLDVLCPTAIKQLTDILSGAGESTPSQTVFPPLLIFRDSFPSPKSAF